MTRLALLALLAVAACSPAPPAPPQPASPVPVRVSVVTTKRVPRTFEAGGVVRAHMTATLASRITAPVLSVRVAAGDRVRAGQSLITFEGRELDANLGRAATEVTALERTHAAAVAERAAAEAVVTLARASHGRIATLHARDAATAQELDEAVSALHGAEARLAAADAQVAAAAASLDGARQAEAAAGAAASYAALTAPFDGLITERLVDPGALATPGAPLLRIDDTRRFRLEVVVDESRLTSIAEGALVEVELDDDQGEDTAATSVNGTIDEISRTVDVGSHSFLVKIDLPAHPAMRSGMFARARFATGSQELLTIPLGAIVPQGQLSTVFVVSTDQRARMRVVDTGVRGADWVEVLAGVSAGEQVIVPPTGIRDGAPVRSADTETRR
jgi:RND family efflux transporter MFP subunit